MLLVADITQAYETKLKQFTQMNDSVKNIKRFILQLEQSIKNRLSYFQQFR